MDEIYSTDENSFQDEIDIDFDNMRRSRDVSQEGGRSRSVVRKSPRDLKEKPWTNDDLNVLQLDIVDRVVFKTAGNCCDKVNEPESPLKLLRSPQPDKRDLIQKDKLTEWINSHLEKSGVCVTDMFQDFRSGQNLIRLIEVLTHEKLVRTFSEQFNELLNLNILPSTFHPDSETRERKVSMSRTTECKNSFGVFGTKQCETYKYSSR